jgi:tripartite-type tricarboxylate transporter receptor subunit TctC
VINANSTVIDPLLRKVSYDSVTNFEPICYLVSFPQVIVVNSASPYRSLNDLLAARALATTPAKRIEPLPNVPTITESGYKDYNVQVWFGIAAPAKKPKGRFPNLPIVSPPRCGRRKSSRSLLRLGSIRGFVRSGYVGGLCRPKAQAA